MQSFKSIHWKHYLKYGALAAAFYGTVVAFFCRDATFTESWLLFAGNLMFLIIIAASLFSFNKQRHSNASTISMLAAGNITSVTGIVLSCILSVCLLFIYVPGLLHSGTPGNIMKNEPANMIHGKTNGMIFMIFLDAVFGNFAAGFAASIIFSFTLKGNQTSENVPPAQSEL